MNTITANFILTNLAESREWLHRWHKYDISRLTIMAMDENGCAALRQTPHTIRMCDDDGAYDWHWNSECKRLVRVCHGQPGLALRTVAIMLNRLIPAI